MFPTLFEKAVRTDMHEITNYKNAFNLVLKLIEATESLPGGG